MGVHYTCDATGEAVDADDLHELGFVIKRQYSPHGAELAQAYLDEVDALHDRLAEKWRGELAALREKHLKICQRLPDVPDERTG